MADPPRWTSLDGSSIDAAPRAAVLAWVAQLVEQRIENPRVGGSNPPPGTILNRTGYSRYGAGGIPTVDLDWNQGICGCRSTNVDPRRGYARSMLHCN